MNKPIEFRLRDETHSITNSWEKLSPETFEYLFSLLMQMAAGQLAPAMVRILYVCDVLGINYRKIKDPAAVENINKLAYQVTFPISIVYPDNNAVLSELPPDLRDMARKVPPDRLPQSAMTKYLQRLEYHFVIDNCFCAQLIPAISVGGKTLPGYAVNTEFDNLTCNLTALQYIEAKQLIGRSKDTLPLMASILYHPHPYDSLSAHKAAASFAELPEQTLLAIAFNFQSFTNYLFTKTHFSLLTKGKDEKKSPIATGALESLYNMSQDGLGDMNTVSQMNIIQYLTVLRKKTIEFVKSLSQAEKKLTEIEKITGLPLSIIKQIV
ncbi:MAG: hypothetical protein LBV74_22785 [Tannerella sp.]|jgi:hypothetical protein|nr:hypothetical protein [Tannerella sp.]